MHLVANHLVESRDPGLSETYGTAVHWGTPSDSAQLNFTSGFRYIDLLEQRDGEWRILERYASRGMDPLGGQHVRRAKAPARPAAATGTTTCTDSAPTCRPVGTTAARCSPG